MWLEFKRVLVFILVFFVGLPVAAVGVLVGFICQMFVWGFSKGPKLMDIFDEREGSLDHFIAEMSKAQKVAD